MVLPLGIVTQVFFCKPFVHVSNQLFNRQGLAWLRLGLVLLDEIDHLLDGNVFIDDEVSEHCGLFRVKLVYDIGHFGVLTAHARRVVHFAEVAFDVVFV